MTNLMKRGNFYGYPTSYRTAQCVISHDGLWFCSCKDKNCKIKRQQNPVPYQRLSDYALRYYKCILDWLFKRNSRWIFTGTFCRCYHSSSIVSYLRNPWKIFKFNFRRKSISDLFQCRKSDYSACYFRSRKRMGHLFKRIYVCPDLAFVDTCTVHYAGKNRI